MDTIGFIGAGNMGECLIKQIISADLYSPDSILVSDIRPERLEYLANRYHVRCTDDNSKVAAGAAVVLLCVKPQNISDALASVKNSVRPETLVISIAAGVRISKISETLGDIAIVRAMPNTAALIGEAAIALFGNSKARQMPAKAESIFSSVGTTFVLDNEDMLDAVTAISGSGPAYYFLLSEELIKAGEQLGLDKTTAENMVLQTAKGAAALGIEASNTQQTLKELRDKVTSPGGTTEAALKVLASREFGTIVQAAVRKAYEKSRQLST